MRVQPLTGPKGFSGRIKATAALADPSRYGRSDRSAAGRWFWEIDRVLLLMIAVLIGIGLIAVAAASPAAAQRYSGGSVRVNELFFFYRQIMWIAVSLPVMILISMMPRERARRFAIGGARAVPRRCSSSCRSSARRRMAPCAGSSSASASCSRRNS